MTTRIVRHPAGDQGRPRGGGLRPAQRSATPSRAAWKRDAVVRGRHRSFNTILTKAGTPAVGGTFRRSIHTAAYLDGMRIGGETSDGNGGGAARLRGRHAA